jgi:hypothetical protein
MDCSICCEEITASSGKAVLGCSHTYHLGCIGRWFLKESTCPLCRQESGEKEKFLKDDEMINFEEEDEEEDEEEEDEDDIPEFNEAALALWTMRKTFEMLDAGQSIAALPPRDNVIRFRGNDSLEYVLTSRSRRSSGLIWKFVDDRGYESA